MRSGKEFDFVPTEVFETGMATAVFFLGAGLIRYSEIPAGQYVGALVILLGAAIFSFQPAARR